MNAEIVNKFFGSTATVLRDYFHLDVSSGGTASLVKMPAALDHISVILSFTGDLTGQFVMGFSMEVGLNMARTMMGNPDYEQFDELCQSAIGELGNMICGMTSAELTGMGYICDIAPPAVLVNEHASMSFGVPTLIAQPVSTRFGEFRICIGMSPSKKKVPVTS
ncbi:chemotaxis protein CheX [bacterium]|nr:chemotaxis protein CheX [bacterium]